MHDIGTAYIEWLKTTSVAAYERGCAQLTDPPIDNVDEALRLVELLIEALEGFAFGCVMAHISIAVAKWFGDEKGQALNQRLRRFLHHRRLVWPEQTPPTLREHFRQHLCGRVAHVPSRQMVEDTLQFITQSHVLAIAFDAAQKDTLHGARLEHELLVGWQHLCACLQGCTLPTVSPLWVEWQRRALRRPKPTEPPCILRIG